MWLIRFHRREAITSRPLLLQAIARQTRHAGQVTLTISSAHGERHKARRAYVRVAGFFARLRQTAEQMDRCSAGIAFSVKHCVGSCMADS